MTEAAAAQSAHDTAIRLLAAGNLHQCLWLPPSPSHGKLRVTFATTSNFDDESLPAVLFVGPMFGTRYFALMLDKLAAEVGVRIICTDRPGLGGASPVAVEERVAVWLETVPVLLERLRVRHVALVAHSAGTLYLLNTLRTMRGILSPTAPYVAMLGPWVHCEHSKVALMNAAAKLPSGVVSYWSGLNQFIAENVLPAASWSGGLVSSVAGLFESAAGDGARDEGDFRDKYGVDEETGKVLEKLKAKYVFTEGVSGGSDEALLLLKKGRPGSWGVCEDYITSIKRIAEDERDQRASAKLRVRLHFAGSDIMIGKGGQEYLEKCWRQDGIAEAVDVESVEWHEANHETVLLDFDKGAMRVVLQEIKRIS